MKRIISNKVYDTKTAKLLGYWESGTDYASASHYTESLYRKKTGEFFLHGHGGPLTQYAQAVGANEWSGGERIMPLTYSEARAWAETHLSAESYEAQFGAVAEDGSRMQVCYCLSATTVETVRRRAAEEGISASEYVERRLKE